MFQQPSAYIKRIKKASKSTVGVLINREQLVKEGERERCLLFYINLNLFLKRVESQYLSSTFVSLN